MRERPLFIPLKRQYFEAFERGEKTEEIRPYGPRWNERTCSIGRPVVLSLGYGRQQRQQGFVSSFRTEEQPELQPGWIDCYGQNRGRAAVIGITLNRS